MLETLNIALAVVLVLGGLLAARGFLPWVDLWSDTASSYLARGLSLCAISAFPRIMVWDIAWRLGMTNSLVETVGVTPINMVANLILLVGVWYILRARHMSIPPKFRHKYNIFTAPGYPGSVFSYPRRRSE